MSIKKNIIIGMSGVMISFLTSCSSKNEKNIWGSKNQTGPISVTLLPKSGSYTTGTLSFTQEGKIVRISGLVSGLSPGLHGIHIHENPDCSADDASSAGQHFSLAGQIHGRLGVKTSHLGDLGNIQAGQEGQAIVSITSDRVSLGSDKQRSIRGRSIVIHSQEDDFKSQPSGESGTRIACAVIP
ncbi:MAG: superoxide dismutase family protein [Deltaproteobacteria bacterium]|nr:superoxide dismutase family protein [Deltaproteobacteria bacterium]